MLRVKRDMTIKANGTEYGLGDSISGLRGDEEDRLIQKGYCDRITVPTEPQRGEEEVATLSIPTTTDEKKVLPNITDMTVTEIQVIIDESDDVDLLYDLLETEQNNKNRKTVIEALNGKIDELEDTDDTDDPMSDLTFNPDDAVQTVGRQ